MATLYLLVFTSLLLFTSATRKDYIGYKILSVTPTNDIQIEYLAKLQAGSTVEILNSIQYRGNADILVSPQEYGPLIISLRHKRLHPQVIVQDVQSEIEREHREHEVRVSASGCRGFEFHVYHTLDEMYAWYDTLEPLEHVTLRSIGNSHENRAQKVLIITEGEPGKKPVMWIDCGIHAREWISHAACLYYINELVTKYNVDEEITRLVRTYDWMILPVVNPDGYAYTHEVDRMWTKNMKPNEGSECIGVNLNRNWGKSFGGDGSSSDPCSSGYHGKEAFSEPETANERDEILRVQDRLKFSYSTHSCGNMWMSPWAWTKDLPSDYDAMNAVAGVGVEAIKSTHGQHYTYGSAANTIYVSSGSSIDWVYDVTKCVYSYDLQFRCIGTYFGGEDEIVPNAEESWNGIIAALKSIE